MNFAYFRKSNYPLEKTISNIIELAKENNWKVLGEVNLPENQGKMILICKPEWVKIVLKENFNLIGFLPCSISVFKKGTDVLVGTGQPAIIKALAQNNQIAILAAQAESEIKKVIHSAAGVDDLKPKYIKLYSTTTCPYCKMEKSWLESKKIEHDVVYVDLDQKEAESMVDRTGQMGVPVTEIQYEDANPEFIVGFDKPKLEQILGVHD